MSLVFVSARLRAADRGLAFAANAPQWFRSEAFAEDLADSDGAMFSDDPRGASTGLPTLDTGVLAAGAEVLNLTLQALRRPA